MQEVNTLTEQSNSFEVTRNGFEETITLASPRRSCSVLSNLPLLRVEGSWSSWGLHSLSVGNYKSLHSVYNGHGTLGLYFVGVTDHRSSAIPQRESFSIKHTLPKLYSMGIMPLHFCRCIYRLSHSVAVGSESCRFVWNNAYWWSFDNSSSLNIADFGTGRKPVCDFLLVNNTNLCPVSHRFRPAYWSNYRLSLFNSLVWGEPINSGLRNLA